MTEARKKVQTVHRTSITMPYPVRDRLEKERGLETFSGQVTNELLAYWEAVRVGRQSLRKLFSTEEIEHIYKSASVQDLANRKLTTSILADIIDDVTSTPPKGDLKVQPLTEKLETLQQLEVMALVNWLRICTQRGEKPAEAVALLLEG